MRSQEPNQDTGTANWLLFDRFDMTAGWASVGYQFRGRGHYERFLFSK
jgi:hypothetical protein